MNKKPKGFRQKRVRSVVLLLTLVLSMLARTEPGHCDLQIEFFVDRSGSMWAPVRGKPKILLVGEALSKLSKDLPPEVALGLRVFPPPGPVTGKSDPGLRVPLGKDNRLQFSSELKAINPKGKAPLETNLKRALSDFPAGEENKLLILLCDGVDLYGKSFCAENRFPTPKNDVRLHIFSLNIKDVSERDELNCLGEQLSGTVTHLTRNNSLLRAIAPICKKAHKEEMERQARVKEELERQRLLQSKTRLKVEFHNTLDSFFAESIEVVRCRLDGQEVPLAESSLLDRGSSTLLLDNPIRKGKHMLAVQYKMWRGKDAILSRESTLEVDVEEGKTSAIQCYPQGAIFHWACTFRKKILK